MLITIALAGCSAFQKSHEVGVIGLNEHKRPLVITYDATSRGAYMVDKNSNVQICAEPAPDAALENLAKISGEIGLPLPSDNSLSIEANSELQSKIVELAGRTQLVLLAREMLYRACEQSINNPNSVNNTATDMFNKVADMLVALGNASEKQADAAKDEAKTKKVEAIKEATKAAQKLPGSDARQVLEDYLKTLK